MIEPVLKNAVLLADVERQLGRAGVHLWWLGQSGFLVLANGVALVIDPYLSDSLTRKYAATDKPHVRMTERVIDPALLRADIVTSSHNHTDHLDRETIEGLRQANADLTIVVPEANRAFAAERLGCDPRSLVGVDAGKSVKTGAVRIHGVPAAHEQVERDAEGRHLYLGYIFEIGGKRIYHAGDTLLYSGMEDSLRPFGVDLALLPINGAAPERRVAGNLNGSEAAHLANAIRAKLVVPMHYEMFTFNTESPALFIRTCMELEQPYRVLHAGERLSL